MPRQPDPKREEKLRALEKRRDEFRKWAPRVAWTLFAIIAGLAAFGWMDWTSLNRESAGQFGDFFGGSLNPFLAFLSFIALLYTIILQTDELATSREELELTRDELAASTDALKTQASYIERQNFESTFFQLVRLHHDIISAMQWGNEAGRAAMKTITKDIVDRIRNAGQESATHYRTEIMRRYGVVLLHYYKNFVVLLLHAQTVREEDRVKYADIINAQLSGDELMLLFYHAAYQRTPRMRELFAKHQVLRGLKTRSLHHGEELAKTFPTGAFGLGLDTSLGGDVGGGEGE